MILFGLVACAFGIGLAAGYLLGADREGNRTNRRWLARDTEILAETRYQLALAGLSINPKLTETLQR